MNKRSIFVCVGYATIIAGLLGIPFMTSEPYFFHILCLVGIKVILASSLNIILNIGELNLAQAAFMGIGAYTSTIAVMRFSLPFWLAMPLAMLVASLISIAIGLLTLRFKGAYFLLFTFLFAELIRIIFSNFWISLFGGIPGLTGIPRPSLYILGVVDITLRSNVHFYYLIVILVLLTTFVFWRIDKSRLGMIFRAISQSETRTEATGINSIRFKMLGCALGCSFAGMAGSLYAHFVGIITPHDFSIHAVLAPIAYVVVGGIGRVFGPMIGTSFLMGLSHFYLRQFGLYELLVYGLIIVIIIRFMPEGLISLPRYIALLLRRLLRRE